MYLSATLLLVGLSQTLARPNFIIFQADDYQYFEEWVPPAHFPRRSQIVHFPTDLPHIERIRTQGLTLKRAYCASPACGTSRYSTITGRYPSRSAEGRSIYGTDVIANVVIPNTKLNDVTQVSDGNDCSDNNMAALLSKNGYRTGVVGKWHLSRFSRNSYTYDGLRQTVNLAALSLRRACTPRISAETSTPKTFHIIWST